MKRINIGWMMWLACLLVACTEQEVVQPESGTLDFQIETRSSSSVGQKVRIYVADRRPELDVFTNPLCLYCPPEWQIDLTAPDASGKTSYALNNLLAQWYKFAFVCVPEGVSYTSAGGTSLDFTQQWLDYSPILSQQNQTDSKDRSMYRKIMDRWLKKNENLTENVTLERITGQLIVDMGILTDQFEKQVSSVEVRLTNVPKGVYVHEQSAGEILLVDDRGSYSYTGSSIAENHHLICANLLPMELNNCEVIVTFSDGTEATYPLINNAESTEEQIVQIKANTRTTLYFNGMEDNEFEVRYAGFNENDANIGIDGDDWDGWDPTKQAYVVEYAVQGQGSSSSRAGAPDTRVKSLTYLLYQQMEGTDYYLIKRRDVPGIENANWPLSRENGMTWEQREALKDTLRIGEKYKAVFVANAAEEGLMTGVNVWSESEDLTTASKYADARLVLPDVVNATNMFYLSVKEIDGSTASHDAPTHCGVVLQRAITRTDFAVAEAPVVADLVKVVLDGEYMAGKYNDAVKAIIEKLSTVPEEYTEACKNLKQQLESEFATAVQPTVKEKLVTDLSNNPLWNCYDATEISVTYAHYANQMDFDRTPYTMIETKIVTASGEDYSVYSFGANTDNSQNRIESVTFGEVTISTEGIYTNQGTNEHYRVTCQPIASASGTYSDITVTITLDLWDLFVSPEYKNDDYMKALNEVLDNVEAYEVNLSYPDLSKQSAWSSTWNIEK